MKERPILDPAERVFTLADVKSLFRSQTKQLILIALVAGLCAFFYSALRVPKYRAEATFKESAEKTGDGASLKELLGGIGGSSQQPQAIILMRSQQVLRPLVEKLGLQATILQPKWMITKILNRLKENFLAEKEQPLVDLDPFVFADVSYEGERKLALTIRFSDRDHFAVLTSDRKKELGKGTIGSPLNLPNCTFTLSKTPQNLKIGKSYPLKLTPWISIVSTLRTDLKIVPDKSNKSVYNLSFCNRDRYLGARILNELMSQYQKYLKQDHDQLALQQLAYLEQRQDHFYGKLSSIFSDHAAYLSKKIGERGFVGIKEEARSFLVPYHEMADQIFQIDLELTALNSDEKRGVYTAFTNSTNRHFAQEIQEINQTIQELKLQKDLFELSLQRSPLCENRWETKSEELKEIRAKRLELELLAKNLEEGKEIALLDLHLPFSLGTGQATDLEEKEQLLQYLDKSAHLLSIREKLLQESVIDRAISTAELEGIDLPTARTLFVNYNLKLDEAEAAIRHYAQLKPELQRPDFEMGSLYTTLTDPFCQKLIAEAAQLNKLLKDEKNRSAKEGERWREELSVLRNMLSDHLDQLTAVAQLNASLIREKLVNLQQVSLDCIYRQLSVLQERGNDAVKEQRQALLQKKQIFQDKMAELRLSAAGLPEEWQLEKWLELKSSICLKMMEGMTQLVEGKTIGHHLHQVESKPLDFAIVPFIPQKPKLYLMGFLGAFAASFASFFFLLIRTILRGFPSSFEKLKALQFPLLGTITSLCDGPEMGMVTGPDLDLLRRLSLFVKGEKVIGLIGGQGPDYSYALGENLARMSLKTIVLRCDFLSNFREEDLPGILQVWKGEEEVLPVRKGNGFDWMTTGGYSPFGSEIVQSHQFKQMIETLKTNYDLIFLLFRSDLTDAETLAALSICEKAVVTVSGEPTEQLTPFIDWAYHEGTCRLTFVIRA